MVNYQRCTRCVMDNQSDDTISFDQNGFCNYCSNTLKQYKTTYYPNEEGEKKLNILIDRLKKENKNKDYDCLMGLSGGLDSSYLAYLGYKWGLRILAVHIDDGFDTEISKNNLTKLSEKANLNLIIVKPDSEQFNDLTCAFIRAGVPNIAIPQDNILFANLYMYAKKYDIKYFLSGGNFALESISQVGNTHNAYDCVNIHDIHKKFGRKPINKLQLLSDYQRLIDQGVLKIETLRPLNYIDYNRERAMNELGDFCGFTYYGSKHHENLLTKIIQVYWFYHKFGVDKRTSHFSSMIVSGQMTREQALEEIAKPLYDETEMQKELNIVLEQLGMSRAEFDDIMKQAPHQHTDYKTSRMNQVLKMKRKIIK